MLMLLLQVYEMQNRQILQLLDIRRRDRDQRRLRLTRRVITEEVLILNERVIVSLSLAT